MSRGAWHEKPGNKYYKYAKYLVCYVVMCTIMSERGFKWEEFQFNQARHLSRKPEGDIRQSCSYLRGRSFQAEEQQMQRPELRACQSSSKEVMVAGGV